MCFQPVERYLHGFSDERVMDRVPTLELRAVYGSSM